MARRFRNFRSNMIRSGRKTFWLAGVVGTANLGAASTAVIITALNAAALALRPFTIVRSRGWFGWQSDQSAIDETQIVHYGNIVVTEQAVAIGVTAVPTPATDNGSNWLVYDSGFSRLEVVTAAGFHPRYNSIRYFDSKAMRKVEEGQDLIEVIETDALSSGADTTSFVRSLIKLH